MRLINLKNSLQKTFVLNWTLLSENFSSGWLYLPCAVAVVGIEKAFIGVMLCTIASMVCLLALLVVRRRRALVLTALKKGMLSFAGKQEEEQQQQLQQQEQVEETQQQHSSPKNNNDGNNTNNNNNNNQLNYRNRKQEKHNQKMMLASTNNSGGGGKNKNSQQQQKLILPSGINSEETIRLSDLTCEHSQNKWPPGASRMFEGSDAFYADLTLDQLWMFCFGARQIDGGSSTSSLSNSPLNFIIQNFEVLIADIGAFTGFIIDGSQTWCALSIFSLLVLPQTFFGDDETLDHEQARSSLTVFGRYFRTNAQLFVAMIVCGAMYYLATSKKFDAKKIRMWFTLIIVGGFTVLGISQKLFEIFSPLAAFEKSQANEAIWKRFFSKEAEEFPENFYAVFAMAKRPVANPAAILLSQKEGEGAYVPLVRQFIVFILCSLTSFFSEGAGVKKNPIPEIVDPSCDIVLVTENQNKNDDGESENVLERAKSISLERDVNSTLEMLKMNKKKQLIAHHQQQHDDTSAQKQSSPVTVLQLQQLPSFFSDVVSSISSCFLDATSASSSSSMNVAVLAKDSVASVSCVYAKILTFRALWYFIFAVCATWVIPMMSWDVSFSTWLGVAAIKLPDTFFNSIAIKFVVAATIVFYVFQFFLLQLPKSFGRFFYNASPSSLYTRYPWTRHLVVLFLAMLIVETLSSAELNGLRSTAMRRGNKKASEFHHRQEHQKQQDGNNNINNNNNGEQMFNEQEMNKLFEQQEQDQKNQAAPSFMTRMLQSSFQTILLGQNPWALISRINFTIGGWRVISIPLLMYSKSEEALKRLGFPSQMISLRSASLLDNGMAKKIALVWMCVWAYFIWFIV